MRRPNLRGHKSSRSSSPLIDETPPLPPQPGDAGSHLRTKRVRTSTVSGQEKILKKRRLSTTKTEIPQLRIPLRNRGGVPKTITPPTAGSPNITITKIHSIASSFTKAIVSPRGKPQYDQFRIIEEEAKASIRGGSRSTTSDERRKLRSEDGGSRAKTELAQYFPDFEEMLSLKSPDPGTTFHEVLLQI